MWSAVTPPPDGAAPCSRSKHSATLLGSHVYLLGGRNGNLPLKDLWKYSLGRVPDYHQVSANSRHHINQSFRRLWGRLPTPSDAAKFCSLYRESRLNSLCGWSGIVLIASFVSVTSSLTSLAPRDFHDDPLLHAPSHFSGGSKGNVSDSVIIRSIPSSCAGFHLSTLVSVILVEPIKTSREWVSGVWGLDLARSSYSEMTLYPVYGESRWELLQPTGERPPCLQEHSAVAYRDNIYVFGGEVGFSAGTETPLWVYHVKVVSRVGHGVLTLNSTLPPSPFYPFHRKDDFLNTSQHP
uniref:Rab9 effector protein with kelch motifs n=1 Tax=Timema cristinae TaxID=61476 RepID=A0A7R9GXI5_TIMCR|nr:unnamed protein product [Timema cristinae]